MARPKGKGTGGGGGGRARRPETANEKAARETKSKDDTKVTARDMIACPTDKQVKRAVADLADLAKAAQEKGGEVGKYVAEIASKQSFDKTALGMVRRLARMSPDKFRITWTHFGKYAAALEFDKKAELEPTLMSEGEMGGDRSDNDVRAAAEPDLRPSSLQTGSIQPNPDKVVPLKPARPVGEEAGRATG